MATTQMLTGDSNTVKRYEMETWMQTMQQSILGDLFDNGAVYYVDKFLGKSDSQGDVMNFDYIARMSGKPVGEAGTLSGNEKAMDIGTYNMTINESRDAIRYPNRGIEPQRTNIQFSPVTRKLIKQRSIELLTQGFFNQLCGQNAGTWTSTTDGETYTTAAEKLHVTGHQTAADPSTNRHIWAGNAGADESLTSADTFSYQLIDWVLEENDSSLQPVMPLEDGYFRLYIDPFSFTNLKNDVSSPIQWGNIALSEIQAGKRNGILEDRYMDTANRKVHAGIYQNVKIFSTKDVPHGVNSSDDTTITTVRRCPLVGRDAVSFASPYGGRISDEDVPLKFIEQLDDYGKYKGEGFELLYGMKRMLPSGTAQTVDDNGSHVISVYSAAHTS